MMIETAAVRGILAEPAGQLEPVHVRHHHVGEHEVGHPLLGGRQRLRAVARDAHVVAGRPQLDLEQARDERVVVDDQQALAAARLGTGLVLGHALTCRLSLPQDTHPHVSVLESALYPRRCSRTRKQAREMPAGPGGRPAPRVAR